MRPRRVKSKKKRPQVHRKPISKGARTKEQSLSTTTTAPEATVAETTATTETTETTEPATTTTTAETTTEKVKIIYVTDSRPEEPKELVDKSGFLEIKYPADVDFDQIKSSETRCIGGFQWHMEIQRCGISEECQISVHLNTRSSYRGYGCFASVITKIKRVGGYGPDLRKEEERYFDKDNPSYELERPWQHVTHRHFLCDDNHFHVTCQIRVKPEVGFRKYKYTSFSQNSFADTVLVVEGEKLHVNKAILSMNSTFFEKLFYSDFAEKTMNEIEIKDVDLENFVELLRVVYPDQKPIDEENIGILIEYADRFDMKYLLDRCESYFLDYLNRYTCLVYLIQAQKYRLPRLFAKCLEVLREEEKAGQILNNDNFNLLTPENKASALKAAIKE